MYDNSLFILPELPDDELLSDSAENSILVYRFELEEWQAENYPF